MAERDQAHPRTVWFTKLPPLPLPLPRKKQLTTTTTTAAATTTTTDNKNEKKITITKEKRKNVFFFKSRIERLKGIESRNKKIISQCKKKYQRIAEKKS